MGGSRRVLAECVADAADGVDELGFAGEFDFGAEQTHEGVEGIAFDIAREAPNGIEERVAGDDVARAAEEHFEESVFGAGEGDAARAALGFAGGGVEGEIGAAEDGGAGDIAAAGDGADAGEEDVEGEGLGEVVVGAGVEAGDDVEVGVAGGEHQDGRAVARLAEAFGDGEAVEAGEHDVEDDDVEGVGEGEGEAVCAVGGDDCGMAFFFEATLEEAGEARFVFDDEDLHGGAADQFHGRREF